MADSIQKKLDQIPVESVSDESLTLLVGYNIKRVSNVIQSDLAKTLKPLDLRMITFTTLVLIVDNPGIRQSQLAASLSIERPNFVVIIDELVRRGLVTRKQDPSDRRAYGLYISTAGQRLHKVAIRAVQSHENSLLAHLSAQQRQQLSTTMNLLRQTFMTQHSPGERS